MFNPKAWLDSLKLPPRYLAVIAIVTGCLLTLPEKTLEVLGVRQFAHDHRHWIGLAFLVTASLLAVAVALFIFGILKNARRIKARIESVKKRLGVLTEKEQDIVGFYILHKTRTQKLPIDNGVVSALEAAGIIYRSGPIGSLVYGFDYNITETAWQYLHEKPWLAGLVREDD